MLLASLAQHAARLAQPRTKGLVQQGELIADATADCVLHAGGHRDAVGNSRARAGGLREAAPVASESSFDPKFE
jgi:hypothetical protein